MTIDADNHLVHIEFALSTCYSEVCIVASRKSAHIQIVILFNLLIASLCISPPSISLAPFSNS